MPTIEVNDITIAYKVRGEGPLVVYTPAGFWTMDRTEPIVDAFVEEGFQILVYDRINTGNSGFDFQTNDLRTIWADQLHALLAELGATAAFLGGASGGLATTLAFAHRYPGDIKALFLIAPGSLGKDISDWVVNSTFLEPAKIAASEGMAAVIEHGAGLLEWDALAPKQNEVLLHADRIELAQRMREWAKWPQSENWTLGGLSDEQLKMMESKAIVFSGVNDMHPVPVAEKLDSLLPNSELVKTHEYYRDSMDMIMKDHDEKGGEYFEAHLIPRIAEFLKSVAL
jgi:2-hydroxy-6-oxonona-2,4-dienedioate hydrolase